VNKEKRMISTIKNAITNAYHWFQLLKKGILSVSFSGTIKNVL